MQPSVGRDDLLGRALLRAAVCCPLKATKGDSPVEKKTVSVRGGMFETEYMQGGSGAPLVFLHGTAGSMSLPVLDTLAQSFTVYAPTHPGWNERAEDLDHLDDVIDMGLYYQDFFDALGIKKPLLVGHSLGGMFAAETAALCSPCISRLVLIAPVGLWRDDTPIPDIFTMGPGAMAPLVWHDLEHPVAKAMMTPPETQEQTAQAMLGRAQSLAATGKFIWPIPDKGLKKRIHRINVPTLLVWGESDKLVPPVYGTEFQQRIAGSKLVTIPNASHMVLVEQADRVADEIRRFAQGG